MPPTPYEPQGNGLLAFGDHSSELLLDGPCDTGKTRLVLQRAVLQCLKYPGSRHLLVRKTRISLNQTVLQTFETIVIGETALSVIKQGASRQTRSSYTFPNGSQIILGGLDHVERLMSGEYDTIIFHEATEVEEDDYLHLITRLRWHHMPYQQVILECNPSYPTHWIMNRVNLGFIKRYKSLHSDNPTCKEEDLNRLRSLTGHLRQRLYEGLWVAAEGAIYPLINEIDPSSIPKEREYVYGGLDFGWRDPFAACVVVKYNNIYYAIQDYEREETQLTSHVSFLKGFPVEWAADPSRPDSIDELQRLGVNCVGANNSILDGINTINRLFTAKELYVSTSCIKLLNSLRSYTWADSKTHAKEVPARGNDHSSDALRYCIMNATQQFGVAFGVY